ncbi:uncharacterized protein OCT59_009512 [Rhizophagus irregularis]|uniref:Uncharacterized protein n=1 Tax=Rhizophagus irregularis TaxID=588596 RepID=A0A916E879_9GLOM|nr:hypothetical protein OCT59_009512 [Rhizophagus irregularis]GBC25047.1 signal recognition particle, alpha subunit, N-terminal-domain-containing protein [Rhizophagus irregularis DAOM 181602=DAOM 197198]CAB4480386.1 unnamed protein product [Rhizophagus irregularis]CAB5193524.1 unnamed protein product [Rhizophagus irregularis]CAB5367422.1 unnamed protein product [Rhizophagus irregularis]
MADLTTCFCLLQNGLKIPIAACNTFKSGAIEQLRQRIAINYGPKQINLMYAGQRTINESIIPTQLYSQ